MTARWWRHARGPYEEWHLLALQPNGTWAPLAIVQARKGDGKRGWWASACLTQPGQGSTWMGSEVRALHRRRSAALRAAEAMYGFERPLLHATWPAVWVGEWDYPPPVARGRQRRRAGAPEPLVTLIATFAQLVLDVIAARRGSTLKSSRDRMLRVVADLAKGDLCTATLRLRIAVETGEEPAPEATVRARESLKSYAAARGAFHQPRSNR